MHQPIYRKDAALFSESNSRYIVSCKKEHADKVRAAIEQAKLTISASGSVGGSNIEVKGIASLDVTLANTTWRNGLSELM